MNLQSFSCGAPFVKPSNLYCNCKKITIKSITSLLRTINKIQKNILCQQWKFNQYAWLQKYFVYMSSQSNINCQREFFSQKKQFQSDREIKLCDVKTCSEMLIFICLTCQMYLSKLTNIFVVSVPSTTFHRHHLDPDDQHWWWWWILCWWGSWWPIFTSGRSPLENIGEYWWILLVGELVISSIFTSGRSPLEGTVAICYQINKHFAHPSTPLLSTTCCMHNHWHANIYIYSWHF